MDDDENFGTHFSPRLYGVWQMAERWTLKGGVSTGFRAPDLRQTVAGWGQVSRGGNMYGNPDLTPEKSVTEEIGILTRSPASGARPRNAPKARTSSAPTPRPT
ncbi:hypothetical protein G6F58_013072 [Rhizopus delemar]|nr:hypothetical protein G6F58_013072 [Rhizopus delemar]